MVPLYFIILFGLRAQEMDSATILFQADGLFTLSVKYLNESKLNEAEVAATGAKNLVIKHMGKDVPFLACINTHLAFICNTKSNYDEAEAISTETLKLIDKYPELKDSLYVKNLSNIANSNYYKGDYQIAIASYSSSAELA